jgi:hypothetical protein
MDEPLSPDLEAWLSAAIADARRRGIPDLEPLLRTLARSTAALRAADWQESVGDRLPPTGGDDAPPPHARV